MIQIVRYSETPAGSYDELLIIPGSFEGPGSKQESTSRMRITRIYVSQHETLWNGTSSCNETTRTWLIARKQDARIGTSQSILRASNSLLP